MLANQGQRIKERVNSLQGHLAAENPLLVEVVDRFVELDRVARRMGLLGRDESFATSISWWPLISVLGTFSAGKSTFINQYLGRHLQQTGNQAVDDKFSVICYSEDEDIRVLPGLALDADPRFPFYQISEEIEKVASGEGGRIDTYLQLKACRSARLRGNILIDSPGFDADAQRDSTLRLTDHIIDLSDLVLVLFDARHPEPGAMKDTLAHLVTGTRQRNDANKILFILNQIDTTSNDDNVEDVVAAWQRAVAHGGVASGRFYCIYNEEAAVEFRDDGVKRRYQNRRDADLTEIHQRIAQVGVERIYRIIGSLENTANQIEHQLVPELRQWRKRWFKRVLMLDALIMLPLLAALLVAGVIQGWLIDLFASPGWLLGVALLSIGAILAIHFWMRRLAAGRMARKMRAVDGPMSPQQAFLRNTRFWVRSSRLAPVGWSRFARKRVQRVRDAADGLVQKLNDQYASPSGAGAPATPEHTANRRGDRG